MEGFDETGKPLERITKSDHLQDFQVSAKQPTEISGSCLVWQPPVSVQDLQRKMKKEEAPRNSRLGSVHPSKLTLAYSACIKALQLLMLPAGGAEQATSEGHLACLGHNHGRSSLPTSSVDEEFLHLALFCTSLQSRL